jgi:glycerol kinase
MFLSDKCTYGTGLFLMMNTGYGVPVPSTNGLLTTVAFKLGGGGDNRVAYALEGSVAFSGSVIQWLRDQLQIISSASESEELAQTLKTNDGLYFVPAFAGLFAPYWRDDARGCILGMTASHTKAHVVRAALESSAYQARDLFDAMYEDSGTRLVVLKVDGGGTKNNFLMQFQADMIDVPVVAPKVTETTAIGAAFAAGLAVGIWESLDEIQSLWALDKHWEPKMDKLDREKYWKGWKKSVKKSFGWTKEVEVEYLQTNRLNLAIAVIGSLGIGMFLGSRLTRK